MRKLLMELIYNLSHVILLMKAVLGVIKNSKAPTPNLHLRAFGEKKRDVTSIKINHSR
jgi:hypothetical protein